MSLILDGTSGINIGSGTITYPNTTVSTVAGIGDGQTWQTVTRASGTTYTNTTGRPIQLTRTYTVLTAGTQSSSSVVINGGTSIQFIAIYSQINNPQATGTIIIPVGASYVITDSNANSVVTFELR